MLFNFFCVEGLGLVLGGELGRGGGGRRAGGGSRVWVFWLVWGYGGIKFISNYRFFLVLTRGVIFGCYFYGRFVRWVLLEFLFVDGEIEVLVGVLICSSFCSGRGFLDLFLEL